MVTEYGVYSTWVVFSRYQSLVIPGGTTLPFHMVLSFLFYKKQNPEWRFYQRWQKIWPKHIQLHRFSSLSVMKSGRRHIIPLKTARHFISVPYDFISGLKATKQDECSRFSAADAEELRHPEATKSQKRNIVLTNGSNSNRSSLVISCVFTRGDFKASRARQRNVSAHYFALLQN